MPASVGEILQGLWRFEAAHPEWTDDEGGEAGWDQIVALTLRMDRWGLAPGSLSLAG
jgi:hypothetical protein